MVRLMICTIAIVLSIGCNPSGKWKSINQIDQDSSNERTPASGDQPSNQSDSTFQSRLQIGVDEVTGSQISGSVSVSNNITGVQSAGFYGQIELNISRN